MFAMALIPMVAMSGSAVDIGRSYLVKTRLQQACDAGVLAGRRAMATGTYGTAEQAQATSYFNTNMSNGVTGADRNWFAGAKNVTFTSNAGSGGGNEVSGSATADVPVTLMKMFGYEKLDLAVTCNARLDISNTDVMMVLDVTGSMNDCPNNDSPGQNGCTTSNNKISGLKAAVVSFYSTIRGATGANTRFRMGFVPYSSTVNFGPTSLTAGASILPESWVASSWTYQSRVANMTTPGWHPTTTYGGWTNQNYASAISNTNCSNYGNNLPFGSFNPSPSGNPTVPTNDVFQGGGPSTVNQVFYERVSNAYSGNQTCTRRYRTATTTYALNGRYGFTNWSYKPVAYDVSQYRVGAVVNVYTANAAPTGSVTSSGEYNMADLVNPAVSSITGTSTTFEGCYEERSTTPTTTTTYDPLPSDAYDLNYTTLPTNAATQWGPHWPAVVYDRGSAALELNTNTNRSPITAGQAIYTVCPDTRAGKLDDRTLADVTAYVNTLSPDGYTFHDLGMAWGLRMASANGIWGTENTTAPNGNPISRHIIFMTDGEMNANRQTYTSHGVERVDNRVGPAGMSEGSSTDTSANSLNGRHNRRFLAMCNAARADGISVWTVAFGTSNPATLQSCADPGQSFIATDSAALQTQFQAIAARIAQLRLSQ